MTLPPRDVLLRIRKLASLPDEIRQSRFAISITRLTVLKHLCRPLSVACRFVTFLARKVLDKARLARQATLQRTPASVKHLMMMEEALKTLEVWERQPSGKLREKLTELKWQMAAEQNEHRKIPFGAVRLITDSNLLLFEYVVTCVLASDDEVGIWAYQTARHYTERYAPSHGTGLVIKSIPLVADIVDFWMTEYGLTAESLAEEPKPKTRGGRQVVAEPRTKKEADPVKFTHRQGQFLAFIHLFRKLHRRGPAETDLAKYFRVTPPAVHGMIAKLDELGLITREPGVPRSLCVAIPAASLPELEEVHGPAW